MTNLEELLTTACNELFGVSVQPQLTRPEEQFGDFASNLALQLAKELKQPPRQVAEQLQKYLEEHNDGSLAKVEVAGPGFLNLVLSDKALWRAATMQPQKALAGKKILLEYSNPTAYKRF